MFNPRIDLTYVIAHPLITAIVAIVLGLGMVAVFYFAIWRYDK